MSEGATSTTVYEMSMWTQTDPYTADLRYFLHEIDEAIHNILVGAQSYTIGSRKLTRADLSQLYKMRQDICAAINDSNNNTGLWGDTYVAVWDTDPR